MIITLLSDLGTKDAAVAISKATLLRLVAGATIVDLSHHVGRANWYEAAYMLRSVYSSFPQGTIHIAAVAPFADPHPRMVMAEQHGHYFIGADNGLLPAALESAAASTARSYQRYTKPYLLQSWMADAGTLVNALAQDGELPPAGFSIATYPAPPPPQVTPINTVCRVLYADRYQNIVVNIRKEEFYEITNGKPFRIKTMKGRTINSVSRHYTDVATGEPLCRFNRSGYLEIAVNHGSAREFLGFPADDNDIEYQNVRIYV